MDDKIPVHEHGYAEDEPLYDKPRCFKQDETRSGYIEAPVISDAFTKYMWPITCSLLVGYNALIALWHLYTVFFVEYNWETQYFVGFGLVISVFVVSYSHRHFIIRE